MLLAGTSLKSYRIVIDAICRYSFLIDERLNNFLKGFLAERAGVLLLVKAKCTIAEKPS